MGRTGRGSESSEPRLPIFSPSTFLMRSIPSHSKWYVAPTESTLYSAVYVPLFTIGP